MRFLRVLGGGCKGQCKRPSACAVCGEYICSNPHRGGGSIVICPKIIVYRDNKSEGVLYSTGLLDLKEYEKAPATTYAPYQVEIRCLQDMVE